MGLRLRVGQRRLARKLAALARQDSKCAILVGLHDLTLARAVRKRLHALGVRKGIPVVFSTEFANMNAVIEVNDEQNKRTTAGTVSYMPAIFGCYLASHVLRNII